MHPFSRLRRQLTLREGNSLRFVRRFAPSNCVRWCNSCSLPPRWGSQDLLPPPGWQGNWIRREPQATENPVTRFPVWEIPRSGQGGVFASKTLISSMLKAQSSRLVTMTILMGVTPTIHPFPHVKSSSFSLLLSHSPAICCATDFTASRLSRSVMFQVRAVSVG